MRYVSTFSGIEAASAAFGPLGWEPLAFSEIEPFPCAVLAHRFPGVPNLGDMRLIDWSDYHGATDLVCGGSPCQSFSVAGDRTGLDGASRLMFEFVRAVRDIRPRWFLWENVPGVLSTDRGRAFGILLDEMEKLGYGMAWRTLDAQFFGVAQRRRRVFLVGHVGGAVGKAAAVLFDRESVRGNTCTSKKKREGLAAAAGRGACFCIQGNIARGAHLGQNGKGWSDTGESYTLDTMDVPAVCCLQTQDGHAPTLTAMMDSSPCADRGAPAVICRADDTANAATDENMCGSLKCGGMPPFVAGFKFSAASSAGGIGYGVETAPTLIADYHNPAVHGTCLPPRRLTPLECERLQGFPDGWTDVPYKGGEHPPDTPRYKALGNSWAVPCARWIAERMEEADAICG